MPSAALVTFSNSFTSCLFLPDRDSGGTRGLSKLPELCTMHYICCCSLQTIYQRSANQGNKLSQVVAESATQQFLDARRRDQQRAMALLREDPSLRCVHKLLPVCAAPFCWGQISLSLRNASPLLQSCYISRVVWPCGREHIG